MASADEVWLGTAAPEYVAAEGEEDAWFCKVGGEVKWLHAAAPQPRCRAPDCGRSMLLVAQMNCPQRRYDRVLCIFACNRTACQLHPGAWTAIRAQVENPEYCGRREEKPAAKAPPAATFAVDDDWGGGGGFGDDAGFGAPADAGGFGAPAAGGFDAPAPAAPAAPAPAAPAVAEQSDDDEWEDADDTTAGPDDGDDDAEWAVAEAAVGVVAPDVQPPAAVPADAPRTEQTKRHRDPRRGSSRFTMVPLDVFVEPVEENTSLGRRAREQDRKWEGVQPEKVQSGGKGGGAAAEDEAYEETQSRCQRAFMDFTRRIERCPAQVVRWGFGVAPLSISGAPHKQPKPCERCGSKRVPETQILSTALQWLGADRCTASSDDEATTVAPVAGGKPSVLKTPGLSFGTATVYTCGDVCDIGDGYAEEVVVVEDEPEFG
eukprot:TRINITY_DN32474_c0_g1_i1.p1 TRINITY_DN32474_c0_g1~~TRINITY_DN32474_c0_g1_i1.p1  ORF type:complete len:432 (+),score=133.33 TRINITY_DN32474_c0_g1_i1:74-1369(+)